LSATRCGLVTASSLRAATHEAIQILEAPAGLVRFVGSDDHESSDRT